MNPMSFSAFIASLELRYFQPSEFLVGLERGNTEPPPWLWPNIALTAIILDRARAHFRRSITITSSHRSPVYNRAVGGSRRSQHPAFTAVDFKVRGVDPARVAELLIEWRGRLFELPITVERVPFVAQAGPVPFAEIQTWTLRGGKASMMRFAGGIGIYRTFTHLDTRGINSTWRG